MRALLVGSRTCLASAPKKRRSCSTRPPGRKMRRKAKKERPDMNEGAASPLILSFSRRGRRDAVASASGLPLPLWERAGVRGDAVRIGGPHRLADGEAETARAAFQSSSGRRKGCARAIAAPTR